MQFTRLHVLILIIGLLCAGVGVYIWQAQNPKAPVAATPSAPIAAPTKAPPAAPPSAPVPKPHPQNSVAPTPSVSPATPRPQVGAHYRVSRGDTLWRIAQKHSPVREGAGWVAIWKTNQATVKNFDRLEIGWTLEIPQDPSEYATPYWKPRMLARRPPFYKEESVDLAQLPVPPTVAPGMPGWPPEMPRALEIALLQRQPLPRALEIALLQSTPMPESLAVALSRSAEPRPARAVPAGTAPEEPFVLNVATLASLRAPAAAFEASSPFR